MVAIVAIVVVAAAVIILACYVPVLFNKVHNTFGELLLLFSFKLLHMKVTVSWPEKWLTPFLIDSRASPHQYVSVAC